jgi:enoyl-CoA hydratase/carnithine racemase
MDDLITVDDDGVAFLCLRGGGPLNILSGDYAASLARTINDLAERADLRALVISSHGSRTFIGGADVKEMSGLEAPSARTFISRLFDACEAVRNVPVPTIARIDAWCIGGGMEFAAACDMRIVSTDARFAMPEVRLGIPSVIHATLLSRLVGDGHARWLLLTGEAIDARKADAWGFATEVCAPEDLDATVARTVKAVLVCEPLAIRAQKRLLRDWEPREMDLAMRRSIDAFGASFETDAPKDRMSAFLDRKKPNQP